MPLVVVTGLPSSGKTRRSQELAEYLRSRGHVVTICNNESLGIDRNEAYKDSQAEKISRGALKTAVERGLTRTETLIADDLNYIKGYRYELYCIARALGTTMCTLHCDASEEQAADFNKASGAYDAQHIQELPARYERPNDRNRWERPLFVVRPDDDALPTGDIEAAITGTSLHPNLATVSQPVADKNMLHEIDIITTQILAAIQKSQADGAAGDVVVPHRAKPVNIPRIVPIGEQRRIKRQFIKLISDDGQTPSTSAAATELFVNFLLKQLTAE